MWDPGQYLRYAGERGRPFFDLLARVGAEEPDYVADLGCGPGNLTAALADRWPAAEIVGVDNSPEMIAAAQAEAAKRDRLSFTLGDVRDWRPGRQGRCARCPTPCCSGCPAIWTWSGAGRACSARAGGWLSSFPATSTSRRTPSCSTSSGRTAGRRCCAAWRSTARPGSPADYLDLLAGEGCSVDAWETTYLHVLPGPDPVVEWYRGTGLRPVLAALDPGQAERFLAEYRERVAQAYPAAPYGTVLPFRRVFVVAQVR